jgi:hypothetical protein
VRRYHRQWRHVERRHAGRIIDAGHPGREDRNEEIAMPGTIQAMRRRRCVTVRIGVK